MTPPPPSLYQTGRLCLSILNTWDGPRWDPASSSLFQVLLAISSTVLGVDKPLYNEPGYGGIGVTAVRAHTVSVHLRGDLASGCAGP